MSNKSRLRCIRCGHYHKINSDVLKCACGGLLEVDHNFIDILSAGENLKTEFELRRTALTGNGSGVWRYRELVLPGLPEDRIISRGEGGTRLYRFPKVAEWLAGLDLLFKHEGENPTGSFKDRGMTVAVSWAKYNGAKYLVCASTGNTSASVASYASLAGIPAVILIPENNTAIGKVAQSMAYGALTLKIRGDFDEAMQLVLDARQKLGLTVLNSVNPFRLEGQKTIIFELLHQLQWQAPDWIVVPGGNLGNTSAFGKALQEAYKINLITKIPRLAVVQAENSAPFARSFIDGWQKCEPVKAETIATAIRIGNPVNWAKAIQAIIFTNGVVTTVTDQQIMDAKALIDSDGVGAEPASCATVAGIRRLLDEGIIKKNERVVAILTGHMLKDPTATIGYHTRTLDNFEFPRANDSVSINPIFKELKRVLKERAG